MLTDVLIIDDSPLMQKMYRHLLEERYRCRVMTAASGEEGLATLAARPTVQLVLLDLSMPQMNGLQFLQTAGSHDLLTRLPVVIIGTDGEEPQLLRGLQLGAKGYLKKPFLPARLFSLIEQLVTVPVYAEQHGHGNHTAA